MGTLLQFAAILLFASPVLGRDVEMAQEMAQHQATAPVATSDAISDVTMPPALQHPVLIAQGQGVQIYSCKVGQWVFVAPAARLFDATGTEIGSHGDGPVWHLLDGSSVLGKVVAKRLSPDAGSVPWLLLKAAGSGGAGKLAGIQFIRRSETKGGVAPSGGCDPGSLLRVPYWATYAFYSSSSM